MLLYHPKQSGDPLSTMIMFSLLQLIMYQNRRLVNIMFSILIIFPLVICIRAVSGTVL